MTDPTRAALTALVARWRAEAARNHTALNDYCFGGAKDGEMLDEEIERGFADNRRLELCADELAACLAGGPGEQNKNDEEHDVDVSR
jgi:hypothetical protein